MAANDETVELATSEGRTKGQVAHVRRRKPRRLRRFVLLVGLGVLALLFFLPQLITSKPVLHQLIARFGGLAPLTVDFDSAHAGWLSSVSVQGLTVSQADGEPFITIGDVQTGKGLLSWAMDQSDLGTIVVTGLDAKIEAYEGTTNVEDSIAHLLQTGVAQEPDSDVGGTAVAMPTGRVEVVDSRIHLTERGRPEDWQLEISSLLIDLPTGEQVVGPVKLEANVRDLSGTHTKQGVIAASVKQAESTAASNPTFEIRAKLETLPVEFWHVAKARLPDLPIEELQGSVSGIVAGALANEESWSLAVQELKASDLVAFAPELAGEAPIHLQGIEAAAKCAVSNGVMSVTDTSVRCDFAAAQINAKLAWPPTSPTVSKPFLADANINAAGVIDLPRLAAAAETLIPLRESTQLKSGQLQFSVEHHSGSAMKDQVLAKLQLSELQAVSGGQPIAWEDPLRVEVSATEKAEAAEFGAQIVAEFASLQAAGTIENGEIRGNLDLSQLRKRMSQWVELPIQEMQGRAEIDANWSLDANEVVEARGTLSTSAIALSTNNGRELSEVAWQGGFVGSLQLRDSQPECINSFELTLNSRDEQVFATLRQPFHLADLPTGPAPPAAFELDLHLDLGKWNRRASVFMSEPIGIEVSGNLQLAASGSVGREHVELTSANWNGQPIQVFTPQLSFIEPRMVGKFKGHFDSRDVTRTEIESLEVTASSISMIAQDQAAEDGTGSRMGRARFLVDLGRLLQNARPNSQQQSQSLLAVSGQTSGPPTAQISAQGRCEGEIAWQVTSTAAGVNMLVKGTNVAVLSQAPGQISAERLWEEGQVTSSLKGTWQAEGNRVELSEVTAQLPWLTYAGAAKYGTADNRTEAKLVGQARYDCGLLSQKLLPYTGGQIQMAGQQTSPIEVAWTTVAGPETSTLESTASSNVLEGLNVTTRMGWQQANVAGIQVGTADIPITVTDGVLRTATEIPVSGGALRWDIESNLAAPELVLAQKPMVMLENVEITEQMCNGWLKFVAPLLAETASVDGRLSLSVDRALLTPANPQNQTVVGQLVIHNARVGPGPLSSSVIGLVKQVEAIRKQEFTQAVGSTERVWMDMPEQQIAFQMVNGRVSHENLSVDIGDVTISTRGSVGVDGSMNMLATMPIPNDWADKSPWLEGLRGQSLDFPLGGTLSQPQVDSSMLAQIGSQTLRTAATGALQQGINRGIGKLLGEDGAAIGEILRGSPQQPTQNTTNENPILGIGGQILKGQGINLPGLFGGQNNKTNPPDGK
jgi:translocation and assembly module TamB